jgi:uncharacterized membrane protein
MLTTPLKTVNALFKEEVNLLCRQLLYYTILENIFNTLEVVYKIIEKSVLINKIKYKKELKIYINYKLLSFRTLLY